MPRTPAELATEGRAAVEADAQVLHLHAYDRDGGEPSVQGRRRQPCKRSGLLVPGFRSP
ncbi:MAG: 3-keto-5-aminohexanoate cleavage protein [Actinomycetota bacterium]